MEKVRIRVINDDKILVSVRKSRTVEQSYDILKETIDNFGLAPKRISITFIGS